MVFLEKKTTHNALSTCIPEKGIENSYDCLPEVDWKHYTQSPLGGVNLFQ